MQRYFRIFRVILKLFTIPLVYHKKKQKEIDCQNSYVNEVKYQFTRCLPFLLAYHKSYKPQMSHKNKWKFLRIP